MAAGLSRYFKFFPSAGGEVSPKYGDVLVAERLTIFQKHEVDGINILLVNPRDITLRNRLIHMPHRNTPRPQLFRQRTITRLLVPKPSPRGSDIEFLLEHSGVEGRVGGKREGGVDGT